MNTVKSLKKQWEVTIAKYSENDTIIEDMFSQIKNAYNEPPRYYHNLNHIKAMLLEVEEYKGMLEEYDSLLLAIWFHDIVYDVKRSDNEQRSAEICENFLKVIRFPYAQMIKTKKLILLTKDHSVINIKEEFGTQLFLDLDLLILGADRVMYQKYAENIRKEYSYVPDDIYAKERIKILEGFLNQVYIFKTEDLRSLYETKARKNIENEINQLQTKAKN